MTKFMKFNDGEITVDFNKSVHVEVDVKHNKTLLEIPGIPADYQDSKKVQVTALPLRIPTVSSLLPMTTRVIQFLRWYKEL